MISMQSSTHSSQMKTVGPAMSLRTSCWLFPQKEQYRVDLASPLAALVICALTCGAVPERVALAFSRPIPAECGPRGFERMTIPDRNVHHNPSRAAAADGRGSCREQV